MTWSADLLCSWQIRWSAVGCEGAMGHWPPEKDGNWECLQRTGLLLVWGFSVERAMLQGAWILFHSFLCLLHQSLVVGVSWEALVSEPAFALVRWLWLLPFTYVWECWHRHQGAEQAGCPPERMKISPVSHADRYEHTVWGMQGLAPLVCDSQEDLCEPEPKNSLH